MNRLMIVARLRDDAYDEAKTLLLEGPPYDPETAGLEAHSAYLTASEVIFVFDGPEVEWKVNELIDGTPRLAHEHYHWKRGEEKLGVGLGV